MTAPSLRDNPTPRESGAALARKLRPMDSHDARLSAGPVSAAVGRIERGSEETDAA
jgi:hypothetical protein